MADGGPRDLAGHTLIYGLAQVATAVVSAAMLPIYTRCLEPAAFGVVALLETAMAVVVGLVGNATATAATRLHARSAEGARHDIWTTGLIAQLVAVAPLLLAAWALRQPIGRLLWAEKTGLGDSLLALLLALTVANLIGNYGLAYLRAEERSPLVLGVTLGSLALRLALNVALLVGLRLGVTGYLLAGVIAGAVHALALVGLLFAGRPLRFRPPVARALAGFAGAIAVASVASLAMHQAGLWLLRGLRGDPLEVGLYAFAFALVQRINALLLTPFSAIWGARLHAIDRRTDRLAAYHRAFRGFSLASWALLLGLAACGRPLVALLAGPAYAEAARLVPIFCAGFFLFSLHGFFSVPALLQGHGRSIALAALGAAAGNLAMGWVLIPRWGPAGAGLAGLAGFALYSLGGHLRYRRLEDLRYPLAHPARLLAVGVGAGAVLSLAPLPGEPILALLVTGGGALVVVALAALAWGRDLLAAPLQALGARRGPSAASSS